MLRKMCMNVMFLCCLVSLSASGLLGNSGASAAVDYPPLAGMQGVEPFTKLLIRGDSINGATGKTVTAYGDAAVANAGKTVTANGNA